MPALPPKADVPQADIEMVLRVPCCCTFNPAVVAKNLSSADALFAAVP